MDRSKGRAVTRREIPIARVYRGPNQHGQKVSVTNFKPAQQIMRLNNFAIEQANRGGNLQVVGESLHIQAVANHAQGNMKRAKEFYLQVGCPAGVTTDFFHVMLLLCRHMEGNMFALISV